MDEIKFEDFVQNKGDSINKNKIGGLFLLLVTERKEGNVLFNDALNIFYLQLYGIYW